MVQRPVQLDAFEFAVLAGLRVAQLARGSTPRVSGSNKLAVIAQQEVAEGKIVREALSAPATADVEVDS
jgi:DNA-directed RNA polymerase subunit K/omega